MLGMVFLPISTVSSVFGTEFFTSVLPEGGGDKARNQGPEFVANPKIKILWAIAIPLTSLIVFGWAIWDNWTEIHEKTSMWRRKAQLAGSGFSQAKTELPTLEMEVLTDKNIEWHSHTFLPRLSHVTQSCIGRNH